MRVVLDPFRVTFDALKQVTDADVLPVVTLVDGMVVVEFTVEADTVFAPVHALAGIGPVILLKGSPDGATPVTTWVLGVDLHFPPTS